MLSKCCCCVPLRTGSITLGVIGLLGGMGTFAKSDGLWFNIVLGIFYIIAYTTLLYGAIKPNGTAVFFSLVCTAIIIVLGIAFGVIIVTSIERLVPEFANNCAAIENYLAQAHLTCEQFKSATIGVTAGIFFASALINTYFWVCNYSFYKELKGENQNLA